MLVDIGSLKDGVSIPVNLSFIVYLEPHRKSVGPPDGPEQFGRDFTAVTLSTGKVILDDRPMSELRAYLEESSHA